MHAAARRVVTVVLLAQVAWTLPLGLVLGVVLSWSALLACCALALAALVVLFCFMLSWQRADAVRASLLATGVRVPASLVASRATRFRVRDRALMAHTFESRRGGRVVRAEATAFAHLLVGTAATIAHDSVDPARAVVVEDLDEVATEGRLEWRELRRRQVNRTFREQA